MKSESNNDEPEKILYFPPTIEEIAFTGFQVIEGQSPLDDPGHENTEEGMEAGGPA